MLQLTQAMAAGRLQGEELNAILDNAQPFVANIQRYLEEAMNIDASRGSGNKKSIGVEICYSKSDGARYEIAEENAVQYIAKLLKEYGWGIDRVKQHYDWFKKNCPHRIRAEGRWNSFLKRIEQAMEPTMPTQPKEEPQVTNTLTSTAKEDLRGY
ncbi:N-acetylmuramoyl-L-alanine amidase XlyB precursor [Lysinibacillus sphaericus OT4b.31]|uniref:Autolysin n=3 Tax=Bacillaceae TaxID=186817 RepID=R7ZCI7_LYSSH|nr:N-acetylmuramoyl-L-alanine amidase XlyB precursor [Lysinibacillus sphaericus OT4b.31]